MTNFYRAYVCTLRRFGPVILLMTLGAVVYGGLCLPKFFGDTTMHFHAPISSVSYRSWEELWKIFPRVAYTQAHCLILIERKSTSAGPVLTPEVEQFSQAVITDAEVWGLRHMHPHQTLALIEGFYYFNGSSQHLLSPRYVSNDERSTLIGFTLAAHRLSSEMTSFIDMLGSSIGKHSHILGDDYTSGLTGWTAMFSQAEKNTLKDIEDMDMFVLPITFLVLGVAIESLSGLVIPILCTPAALCLSAIFLLPLARTYEVAGFSPSIFMSLIVAMSLDYSLFLLTRYREEIDSVEPCTNEEAVETMLRHAGKTVLVSGTTLACSFAALLVFPIEVMATMGGGASIVLVCTMLVNLLVTPTMLLAFPRFFRSQAGCKRFIQCKQSVSWSPFRRCCPVPADSTVDSEYDFGVIAPEMDSPKSSNVQTPYPMEVPSAALLSTQSSDTSVLLREERTSTYHRIALCTQKYSMLTIVLVLLLGLPIAYFTVNMQVTVDEQDLLLRGTKAVDIYRDMAAAFPGGHIFPSFVFMQKTKDCNVHGRTTVFEPGFYQVAQAFSTSVMTVSQGVAPPVYPGGTNRVQRWQFDSYNTLLNQVLTYEQVQQYRQKNNTSPEAAVWREIQGFLVSEHKCSFVMRILTDFEPLGYQSKPWIAQVNKIVLEFQAAYPDYTFYFEGAANELVDTVDTVYDMFPTVIALSMAVVFVLISLAFRSLIVSIRLLVTIAFTLSWVYGAAVLVFQEGVFDSMSTALKNSHGMYWMVPVLAFSVLVGLTLDYDVFLMSRIYEYRCKGYTDKDAVTLGLVKTGPIITSAGVIMLFAFSSLLLSKEMVLNQFGFLLCFAVLMDTFVVRTLLVPAIMHVLPTQYNWWPGHVPPATKRVVS